MNENRNIQEAELDRMVQAYFDCTLTAAEECELGFRLAALGEDRLTGDRRDALAEISLAVMTRCKTQRMSAEMRHAGHRTLKRAGWIAAAAVAAVAAVIVMPRIWTADNNENECYAYVDGRLVTDKDDISRMMERQMADMAEAMDDFYNEIPLNL